MKIQGHLPLPVFRLGVAEHEDSQGFERETPDHTKGVEGGQQVDVAATEDYGEQLQTDNQVDNAIAGAVAFLRLLESSLGSRQ